MNYLFKSLLHWLLFSGTMFFAAGAVVGEVDAGTGGGDSDAAGDSAGDLGGSGDGVVEGGTDDGSGAESGAVRDAGTDQSNGDGRTLPKEVQAALKTLKELHPEHAKALDQLRKDYFSARQHGEFFKTPAEARQAHAALQLVGGHEGIANLQSRVAEMEQVDSSFEQGDPQVLDHIAKDFPDGFKKLVAPALDKLQKLDPQAYGKTIQPHVFAAMETAGMGQVLDAISAAIAGNDLAGAKDLIGKSLAWYKGQQQQAGQRQRVDDPERQQFEADRTKFNNEKEQSFRQDIGRDTSAHQRTEIEKTLAPYLKTKTLTAEEKADITAGINGRVNALLKADATYQSQMKALLSAKNRDPEKIKQYVKAAVSDAVRSAVQSRYGKTRTNATTTTTAAKPGQQQQRQQQQSSAASGPIKIAAKPNREDVDWSKTKDIMYITNKAVMKSGPYKGKTVTWK
jgi:hypothetical protein